MKVNDFDKERLLDLIGALLDDWLDNAGRQELADMLKSSPDAREIYRNQADLHARLHLDHVSGLTPALMREVEGRRRCQEFPLRRLVVGAIAACLAGIAVVAAMVWPKPSGDHGFARIESTSAARWESSELPTTTGSRLDQGTLRLAEGMVSLRFDSGAELTIEAPAELTLVDAMLCILSNGTAVADVPVSAHGFRISTPTGWGLASLVPEATFGVYGLLEDSPWDEGSLTLRNAPANQDKAPGLVSSKVAKLGSFVLPHGVQRGRFGIDGERLVDFLRERAGSEVTLIVIRETPEIRTNGLVHGFASRRHPELPGPALSIRLSEP